MGSNPLKYSTENERLKAFYKEINDESKQLNRPPDWLEHLDSPFKWYMALQEQLLVNTQLPDKFRDYRNQGADYGFEKFCLMLSLMFMKSRKRRVIVNSSDESSDSEESSTNEEDAPQVSNASSKDEDVPTTYSKFDPELAYTKCKEALEEMAAREGDAMYDRIGPALSHVLQATRAQMLYFNGDIAESKEMASNIQLAGDMPPECLAGFEGIKAKFILSVYRDVRLALEASQRAMELDPLFAAWPYLTAKIIRRLRREFKEEMPREELEYFEKAVELEKNPKYIVFLAQAYQEMALSILQGSIPGSRSVADEMLMKAADLFRECWSMKNDSAPIARRVGNGMMKMRGELMDLALTKQALLKAVELSTGSVTLHSLGKFYLIHEHDEERALECFRTVGSIFGNGEIIRYNLIKDPNYDPYDLIQKWIVKAEHIVKKDIIYCDVGWYYLYFKQDVLLATKYFWNVLMKDPNSFRLLKFVSFAFCVQEPVNMLKILVNEIMLLKMQNHVDSPKEEAKTALLSLFLEKVLEKHPELGKMRPNPDMLKSLIKSVERGINSQRMRLYKTQVNRFRNEPAGSWRERRNTSSESTDEQEEAAGSWRARNHETLGSDDVRIEGVNDSRRNEGWSRNGYVNRRDADNNPESFSRGGMNSRQNSDQLRPERGRSGFTNYTDQEGPRGNRGNITYINDRERTTRTIDGEETRQDRMISRNSNEEPMRRDGTRFGRGNDRQGMRGSGRTWGNYSNNQENLDGRRQFDRPVYNNNRYDVTITDWRRESRP